MLLYLVYILRMRCGGGLLISRLVATITSAKRESYQAEPEKKQTAERERYQADPEKKQTAERERYKADPEKKRSAKGNVIWRVLNVLAWRRECGTGRLSVVPCKTNEAIEKI